MPSTQQTTAINTTPERSQVFFCNKHSQLLYNHGEILGLYWLGGYLFSTLILSIGHVSEYIGKLASLKSLASLSFSVLIIAIISKFYCRDYYQNLIAKIEISSDLVSFQSLSGKLEVVDLKKVKKFNKIFTVKLLEFVMDDGTFLKFPMAIPKRNLVLKIITETLNKIKAHECA